ncbi:hypothetical protein [Nocardia sp. NPDC050406]|uniref:hypothetical protein n=1 Tax=Nocardia sp. NPDC050406 TaxID=3364318 RepID=UPI00378EFBCF
MERESGASTRTGALALIRNRWPSAVALVLLLVWRPDEQFDSPEPELFTMALLLFAMGAIYLPWGAFRAELRPRWLLWLQTVALFGFGTMALVALDADLDIARWVLAIGWLAHGLWDIAHFVANRVVPRQWSEFCGLVDVLAGSAMLWAVIA